MKNTSEPVSCCIELLEKFQKKQVITNGEKMIFSGIGGRDVYNISKPFILGNKTVIAGRVEARGAIANSEIIFFRDEKNTWAPIYGAPTFKLEDGFILQIGNEIIFSGVETSRKVNGDIFYRTVFYRGHDLWSLKKFAVGPNGMKDIRLCPLPDGRIGVFTRPQGGVNGKGKIGYLEIRYLEDLNPKNLLSARIIENQFAPGEWGGVNDPQFLWLKKDRILVNGHIAYEDGAGAKHYYAMSFKYDTKKHKASPIEIIATRKNFPDGSAKTPKHEDIVFLSGLVHHNNSTATIYAGLSDAEAGKGTGSLVSIMEDEF
jgi:hypothetical protein